MGSGYLDVAKKAAACLGLVGLISVAVADYGVEELLVGVWVDGCEILLARQAEGVEGTGPCQAFEVFAVAGSEVDVLDEVEYVAEWSVAVACLDYGAYGAFAHALDGSETEADGSVGVDGKFLAALVDVGPEGLYAHGAAFVHEFGYLGYVVEASAHDGCHPLGWVVGLDECGLECHP